MYNSKAGFIFMNKEKCCYIDCKRDVIGRYSVDVDLPKFPFCKKHKENVWKSLAWATLGLVELSNHELGIKPKRKKRENKSRPHTRRKK